jgi:hypothetical protein
VGRSKVLPAEGWFYEAKLKLIKFTGIKGPIRKILKLVAAVSMSLDYRPILVSHQLFRETVTLNQRIFHLNFFSAIFQEKKYIRRI